MNIEKLTVYFIEARTGCSCCYDNFVTGPFTDRNAAETRVSHYKEVRRLASQYSATGNYSILETEGEKLPDGRIIAHDRVFSCEGEENSYFDI